MERILSVAEMRAADKYTIEKLGIPERTLMARAGEAVAEEIKRRFKGGRILFVCGKGNNGGDGMIAAKLLRNVHGFSVFLLKLAAEGAEKLDYEYDIIVDCIFGTGLTREVEGEMREVIEKINAKDCFKISVDIPSGLSGDSGRVCGAAVKADLTISIQEYKTGHFLNDGKDYCGKVVNKDIGIAVFAEGYETLFSAAHGKHAQGQLRQGGRRRREQGFFRFCPPFGKRPCGAENGGGIRPSVRSRQPIFPLCGQGARTHHAPVCG